MLKSMHKSKNRYFHVPQPTFLFPLETPLRLSHNMLHDGKTIQCLPNPSQHIPIYLLSKLFEPQLQKNRHFYIPQPTFLFPWRRPCDYHAVCCMNEKTIQCPRSMCLSIFNSFRVIQCLSQCVSPKIAIFTQFWFPLGTPLGQ